MNISQQMENINKLFGVNVLENPLGISKMYLRRDGKAC